MILIMPCRSAETNVMLPGWAWILPWVVKAGKERKADWILHWWDWSLMHAIIQAQISKQEANYFHLSDKKKQTLIQYRRTPECAMICLWVGGGVEKAYQEQAKCISISLVAMCHPDIRTSTATFIHISSSHPHTHTHSSLPRVFPFHCAPKPLRPVLLLLCQIGIFLPQWTWLVRVEMASAAGFILVLLQ